MELWSCSDSSKKYAICHIRRVPNCDALPPLPEHTFCDMEQPHPLGACASWKKAAVLAQRKATETSGRSVESYASLTARAPPPLGIPRATIPRYNDLDGGPMKDDSDYLVLDPRRLLREGPGSQRPRRAQRHQRARAPPPVPLASRGCERGRGRRAHEGQRGHTSRGCWPPRRRPRRIAEGVAKDRPVGRALGSDKTGVVTAVSCVLASVSRSAPPPLKPPPFQARGKLASLKPQSALQSGCFAVREAPHCSP